MWVVFVGGFDCIYKMSTLDNCVFNNSWFFIFVENSADSRDDKKHKKLNHDPESKKVKRKKKKKKRVKDKEEGINKHYSDPK